ncbi:MAG TPA: hypothetical protein VES88_10515 [Gemmatimonadaceae bacterium]|nr:hypothetical protein [Gemmatimonadaceae bacterium]
MHFSSTNRWYSAALLLASAAFVVVSPSTTHAQATAVSALSPDLQAAKAALAKYSDPLVAVRDGYFSTVACIDFPKGAKDGPIEYPPGAMGVHFLNPANIGPVLDPAKPQVLIYEQVGDKLVLTAAEWFMPVEAAGGKAPTIFGQTLYGPMDGHEPIMPASLRHYDLHVWLWKGNPRGIFTSTNASVKCAPGATYTVALGEHGHQLK